MRGVRLYILPFAFLISNSVNSQDSLEINISMFSSQYFRAVSEKADRLNHDLDTKSSKILRELEKQEKKISKKLAKVDSVAADNILTTAKSRYEQLQSRLGKIKSFSQYIPQFDTLMTGLKFLEQNPVMVSKIGDAKKKLEDALDKVKELEANLQKAEEIKQFIKERQQYLKDQLKRLGLAKQLKKINKQVYYYSLQLKEFKEMIKEEKKIERKVIELLTKTKLFKDFMKRNSILASLFPMPGSNTSGQTAQVGFAALQTRTQLNGFIQQASMGNSNITRQFQQNISGAQAQVADIRQRIAQLSGGNPEDLTIPDFKPNSQKVKSFFKRLEYGANFQSQPARTYFPVTTDFGLSIGYKLNDKSIVGIGASYKIGWGTGWNNIRITQSGIGFRSFLDWKIKGELWLSGGYEQNYRTEFNSIDELRNLNAWQQSGLIGVSKTFNVKTKILKGSKLQLLWDYLSYNQRPRTQPLLFRIGYNF